MTHPYENTNRAKLRRELCGCIEESCVSTYSERVEGDFDRLLDDVLKAVLKRYEASPKAKAFAKDLQVAFRKHLATHEMAGAQFRHIAHHASLKMMERARFDLLHGIALDIANGYEVDKARVMAVLNEIDLDQDGRPDWKQ